MSTYQWRRGDYQRRARAIKLTAHSDPTTRCGLCGRTLDQHPHTKTGNPPTWTADHIRPGDETSPLQAAVWSCNSSAGASMGNRRRIGLETTVNW